MGVLHGSSVLYYAKGLQIKDVVAIAKGLAADRGMATPTIDVDCSNVCFKVGKNVQHLANFLMRWSDPGLCITPVCDNTIRPISKQATNKRKADRERNRIKASILRKDIRELRRRFYEEPNNRQAIQEEISKKEKAWFEEWFLHFEYKWGRTLARLWDAAVVYGPIRRDIQRAIANKYTIERDARQRWPRYASHSEDMRIRKPKWNNKYRRDQRVVMWDMTNITAYGFTDADLQRLTYSKYYAENCLKGGVFTQPCGWIGTAELWPGAVSDSDYNKREGYLERQRLFAEKDFVEIIEGSGNCEVLPFTNVYDKGYRAKMVAWKCGKQLVLQPEWAESDKHFSRKQTMLSASVATDRAGNERGVNVSKRSWFVERGLTPNMSPQLINDAWTTWSFQSNFMFDPVL